MGKVYSIEEKTPFWTARVGPRLPPIDAIFTWYGSCQVQDILGWALESRHKDRVQGPGAGDNLNFIPGPLERPVQLWS